MIPLLLLGTILAGGAGIAYAVYHFQQDRQREESRFRATLLRTLKKTGIGNFRLDELVQREEVSQGLVQRVTEEVYGRYWQKIVADGQITDSEKKQIAGLGKALMLAPETIRSIEQQAKEGRFRSAAATALADGTITDDEAADLLRLRRNLGLSDQQTGRATADMARDSYLALFRQLASDGRITPQEVAELQRLQAALGMSVAAANAIVRDDALNLYRLWFTNIVQDGEVTEEEERALEWLVKQFQLPVEDVFYYQSELQDVKSLTEIRRGRLPSVRTTKLLDSGEICHWQGTCRFGWETAKQTKEAHGELLVTSERLLFASSAKNVDFSPSRILDVQLFGDAIQIQTSINRGTGNYFVDTPRLLEAILVGLAKRHKFALSEQYSSCQTRHIPDAVRREVWQRDGGCCTRCSATEYLEFDHIIPHGKGGANTLNNVQLLCRRCNNLKRDRI